MTSEELHRRCRERDAEAWTYAYNYVLAYLRKTIRSNKEIYDIAHDTILYFLEGGVDRVENPKAFEKLLRLKARGLFIDRRRYEKAHPGESLEREDEEGRSTGQNPDIEPVESDPESALFLEKATAILKTCLDAMCDECAELLKRYFRARFMGEKIKDLAMEMGKPASTLRVMIHRAYKKLLEQPAYRAILEEYRAG